MGPYRSREIIMVAFIIVLFIIAVLLIAGGVYLFFAKDSGIGAGAAVVGIVLALIAGFMTAERATAKDVTFKVSDKAVVGTNSGNGHQYQIFDTRGNVYKDVDSFAFFKFNSSNIYAQLQKGHTYTCEVSGFRIPILSQSNNIIKCHEVAK